MSSGAINVDHLTKFYGPHHAVKDISFSVKKGEVVGFLGPNGAGKTTTMKIVTGYMAPSEGEVKIAGFDVFENPIEVKRKIGYLPETPPVYPDMYVEEYLQFVAKLKGVDKPAVQKNVEQAIEKTHLGDVRRRLIGNLSKGFRQRVGIAQAIVSNPEILILDEPTVGLDPKQVAEIRNLIKELRGQHTIVLSTHILPEVQAMCERVIIINSGEIVAEDTLKGLANRISSGSRIHLKVRRSEGLSIGQSEGTLEKILSEQEGVRNVVENQERKGDFIVDLNDSKDDQIENIASLVVSAGAGLIGLNTVEADLEDIFIKLTSGGRA